MSLLLFRSLKSGSLSNDKIPSMFSILSSKLWLLLTSRVSYFVSEGKCPLVLFFSIDELYSIDGSEDIFDSAFYFWNAFLFWMLPTLRICSSLVVWSFLLACSSWIINWQLRFLTFYISLVNVLYPCFIILSLLLSSAICSIFSR